MATLNKQSIPITGAQPVFTAAAAGGDDVYGGEHVYAAVRNADTTAATVTLVVPGTEYGQARPDVPVVCPAAAAGVPSLTLIGPLKNALAGTNGRVSFTYSKVTALTVAALDL